MICVCNDFGAKDMRPKLLNCIHDRKQLLFYGGVILLSLIQCSTSIVDHNEFLVPLLPQNCPHRMVVGIAHDLKGDILIGWLYDGARN